MDAFGNWWTTTHPGLDCLLISDNLAIHKNSVIVGKAKDRGINMLNIMPGSSHWFQVHDQQPFAILKKSLMASFYNCFSDRCTNPEASLEIRMAKFYEAERKALSPGALLESMDMVGLRAWNPTRILDNCRKHSPVTLESSESDTLDKLARRMIMYNEKQKADILRLRSTVKRVRGNTTPKVEKRKQSSEIFSVDQPDSTEGELNTSINQSIPIYTQIPAKRAKVMQVKPKTCSSKGCQKRHFFSKKWVFCPKSKKNFCEQHKHLLHNHKC